MKAARRELQVAAYALLLLAAWDLGGFDLALSRAFATAAGFPWRDSFVASRLLHDDGRLLAGLVLLVQAWDVVRPLAPGPSRAARAGWLALVAACLVAVPALKHWSATSCPWDVAGLGGRVPYVPHWRLDLADGGPGHCFPSGHAVAAFAFFPLYFAWREHRPRLARRLLAGVLVFGALFGAAQLVRGAHFLTHSLWSGWLCWTASAAAARTSAWRSSRRRARREDALLPAAGGRLPMWTSASVRPYRSGACGPPPHDFVP